MINKNDNSLASSAKRSALSVASPTKLNIMSSQNGNTKLHKVTKRPLERSHSLNIKNGNANEPFGKFSRPKISVQAPPLLKRNSSFFKEKSTSLYSRSDFAFNSPSKSQELSKSPMSSSQPLPNDDTITLTDRFLPTLQSGSQNKVQHISLDTELPPPNASPVTHLRAQTKLVFKQNVAEACGLEMDNRILQYLPAPPSYSRERPATLMRRHQYHYQNRSSQTQLQKKNTELMKLRKVNTNPERILDAPGFQDDFYLNLIDWSKKNILAIALNDSLYLWNGNNGEATLLKEYEECQITSVHWSDDDCHISIGKSDGNTEIWDVETSTLVRTMRSKLNVRIGSQSWLETLLTTGFRSGEIQINDVRIKDHIVNTWDEHTGEVCGLSYKADGLQLASGGNDNTMMIWDTRTSMPQFVKKDHSAAVKALAWSPTNAGLLASGGGQTDQQIHFWNSTTGAKLHTINTGSQVSSLHWGQSYDTKGNMNVEIVATGGSPDNSISIYNYETRYKVAEVVHAHDARICCSKLSPDGTVLATIGGDENLKFYKIFEPKRKYKQKSKGNVVEELMTNNTPYYRERLDGSRKLTNNDDSDYESSSYHHESVTRTVINSKSPSSAAKATDFLIR